MSATPNSTVARPLADVRVLDLTRLLPGPMSTLILADLGARVDKLEDPGAGDYLRHMPPQRGDTNGAFLMLNRDKRSIVLDLKHADGAATLSRMLAHYDVLVESFRPGVLARFGLSHDRLLELHPRLIVCAITGYGQNGPLVHRAGHDINYLARAGVLSQTGPADAPPAVSGAQMADVAGGAMWAVIGILGALHGRAHTGRGRLVDVSMSEGSVPLGAFALGALTAGAAPFDRGSSFLNGGIAPYATYRTEDGRYVALGALEPKFWQSFCDGVGIECTLDALTPGPHQTEWRARVAGIIASRSRDAWATFGAEHDCCLEPVLGVDELGSDPQHVARNLFFDIDGIVHVRTPVGDADSPHTLAPRAGAHTTDVLVDAGYTLAEIATLRERNVVR